MNTMQQAVTVVIFSSASFFIYVVDTLSGDISWVKWCVVEEFVSRGISSGGNTFCWSVNGFSTGNDYVTDGGRWVVSFEKSIMQFLDVG